MAYTLSPVMVQSEGKRMSTDLNTIEQQCEQDDKQSIALIKVFPFLDSSGVLDALKQELPTYWAKAVDYSSEIVGDISNTKSVDAFVISSHLHVPCWTPLFFLTSVSFTLRNATCGPVQMADIFKALINSDQ